MTGIRGVAEDDHILGSGLAVMIFDPARWIHRRTESIRFGAGRSFVRASTLDLTVPPEAPSLATGARIIPVALLRRAVLSGLDTLDEDGRPLPVLTTSQNAGAAAAVLTAMARTEGIVDPAVHHVLRAATGPDRPPWTQVALELRAAGASPTLAAMAKVLYDHFLLCLVLPAADDERRIIKYLFRQEISLRSWRRPTMALGWIPARLQWSVGSVALGESYHVEVSMPEGLVILDGELRATSRDRRSVRITAERPMSSVGHWHLRPHSSDADATLSIRVVVSRSGWLTAAMLSTWLTAGVMVATALGRHRLTGDAAASLLLALNGLTGTLVARPAAHDLVAHVMRGLKGLLILAGLVPYVAAGLLALEVGGAALGGTLWGLTMLAWVAAVSLTSSFLLGR